MGPPMAWQGQILRVERLLFESELVRIGAFRCPPADPLFRDTGPIGDHVMVFPRTSVRIQHESRRPFVASPNIATLYNRGQVYWREAVGGQPDRCDWFAIAPSALVAALGQIDRSIEDRPDHPFTVPFVATSAAAYLRQRRLVEALLKGARIDHLKVEEEVMGILASLLDRPTDATPAARSTYEKVEDAKRMIAEHLDEPLRLEQIAAGVETSVYHLCRIFRRLTGSSIHAWREQMRLRVSLESVARTDDLLGVAVDLNYSSHSHFTSRFRRAFGVPPSVFRATS